MNEERTIDLKELLKYVALKWRMIIVLTIIFAVLADGYAALKSYSYVKELEQNEQSFDFSQYEDRLTAKEIQEVRNAVENYNLYKEKYLNYKSYNENSIKMKIDATEAPTQEIVYEIRGNKSDIVNISDAYTTIFPNDDVCEKILEKTQWDTDISYIKELISLTNTHMNNIAVNGQGISEIVENVPDENKAILISIKVLADNEENCKVMAEIIEESLVTVTTDLQEQFGDFSIKKISDEYGVEINGDLLDAQQNNINEMNDCNNAMNALDDVLSEDQRIYFNALINENILSEGKSENNAVTVSEEIPGVQYINIKYLIVGAIIGCFIACFYAICRFFLDKHLVSKSYIIDDLKYPLLGTVCDHKEEKFNKIDQLIKKAFDEKCDIHSEDEQLLMMCTEIKVIMQKKNLEKIYITSTINSNEVDEVIKKFVQKLSEDKINCSVGKQILYNAKSLEEFSESDGVIFVEQINKSLMRDISKEAEECQKYNVINLGFVLIEN